MLHTFTASVINEIEETAIKADLSQESLMENAGQGIAQAISDYVLKQRAPRTVILFAGKGNNGGDGFVAGSYLLQQGYTVFCFQVQDSKQGSLSEKQKIRFIESGGVFTKDLNNLPQQDAIILDAIWGIGFSGRVDEKAKTAIQWINNSKLTVFSIDVPSGLNATTGNVQDIAVIAHWTLTIEFAKTGFFLDNGWNYVGKIIPLEIGLQKYAPSHTPTLQVIEEKDILELIPPLARNCHKYSRGYVVGLSGQAGMQGASLMSCYSALKSGAGIVHLLQEEDGIEKCSIEPLEVVRIPYNKNDFTTIKKLMKKAGCFFVGPGFGTSQEQKQVFENILDVLVSIPAVIDADALNILSLMKKEHGTIPEFSHAICTPHSGEMQRLLGKEGKEKISLEYIDEVQKFVDRVKCHLVLKGAPSILFSPKRVPVVMTRGSPGMATAGSGDVLTGIVSSIYAQKKNAYDAMLFGTYLHALAGEAAAKDETPYAMTATSIINHLPCAWHYLLRDSSFT